MGLVLTFLAILGCLLCILINVDSYSFHSPNDRPRHQRSHNQHRAPYKGFDWDLQGYERNFDPMPLVSKGKKKGKLTPDELQEILNGSNSSEE